MDGQLGTLPEAVDPGLLARLGAWIDRWVPDTARSAGAEQIRKARTAVAITLLGMVLTPMMAIDHIVRGRFALAGLLIFAVIGLAFVLRLIRTRGWTSASGHIVAALMSMSLLESNGLYDPPILGPIVFPVVVTFVSGQRGGWLWCGFAVAVFVGFGSVATGDPAVTRAWVIALILVTVALTGIAHAFETLRRKAFVEQERARRKAQAAAEAKSRFVANMSHEIRTPMNGVLGMLGILLDSSLRGDQRSYAETAHASGVVLLDLINDILDFSKIDAGQMMLEASPFDLRALVEDVLDQTAVTASNKDVELVARYVPGTPTHVIGDDGRIRQIVLNLVSNAVKFTDSGHVLVEVTVDETRDEVPRFRISVEDTGIGIPPEQHASVFKKFQQVDGSTTRTQAGTGLGLAIVDELVRLMGGRRGLESDVGKGSTFWFELPLLLAEQVPDERVPEPELAGVRILIVDDHKVNRWVLREQLTRWGLQTEECGSGRRALELLREATQRGKPHALAVLDFHMPRMDGLELAQQIRADDSIAPIVLVMLSSVTHRPSAEQLRGARIAAYMVKPMRQSDLMDVLASAWAARDASGSLPITVRHRAPSRTEGESVVAAGTRVLVVEDNTVNQKVAKRLLTDLGCRVDVAADGVEALSMSKAVPYDLVFMDVQMPRMDGLEATRKIREREGDGPPLPIIALTAHAMPEDRQRCDDAGMNGYVSKPVKRRELIRELRRFAPPPEDFGESPAVDEVLSADVDPERDSEALCDLAWLRAHYDPSDEALRQLAEVFFDEAGELLEQLREAERTGDAEAYARGAHALKGSCGTIRATQLYERLARKGGEAPATLDELEAGFARLRQYLSAQLGL